MRDGWDTAKNAHGGGEIGRMKGGEWVWEKKRQKPPKRNEKKKIVSFTNYLSEQDQSREETKGEKTSACHVKAIPFENIRGGGSWYSPWGENKGGQAPFRRDENRKKTISPGP